MDARVALEHADSRALLMSVVHLGGPTDALGRLRAAIDAGAPGRLTDDEKAALREAAVGLIEKYDGSADLPPLPANDMLLDMMAVSAGEPVGAEYVPLLVDEAAFYERDPRAFRWHVPPPASTLEAFHVLVVGGGMSGICAGLRLRQAGIRFTIVEKNADFGGTWRENRYPGCGVDTPNHFYCYSFAPNPRWPRYFSKRDEILDYFISRARELRPNTIFGVEVVRAAWRDGMWDVELSDGQRMRVNAIISAVGLLNRPKLPSIDGMDDFEGPAFHSARWPDDLDVAGKRVAIIGTGASAFQIGPAIADAASSITVFQRSAPWVMPDPTYHRDVAAEEQWLFEHLPFYAAWYRFRLLWTYGDRVHASLVRGSDEHRDRLLAHLRAELAGREDLVEACTPSYAPYGKRMLIDNNWFSFLRRDDVRLVTAPIGRIVADGVVTGDGAHYPADVIVYATGFDATDVLASIEVRGRSGDSLRDRWGDSARAYLGITVPDFPNLFCIYGPNTNLAHGGSAIFNTECQVTYVMGCLRAMVENGWATIECRDDVHDEYNDRVDAANARMPWAGGDVGNWFKNDRGRVVTNSPWRLVDYWSWTRQPNFSDYHVLRGTMRTG